MPNYLMLLRNTGYFYEKSPEEMQQIVDEFSAWAKSLRAADKLVDANPLANSGRIIASESGRITDGPFTETKEMIGGYFLVDAANYEEAAELAKGCPGLKYGETVEVREIGH